MNHTVSEYVRLRTLNASLCFMVQTTPSADPGSARQLGTQAALPPWPAESAIGAIYRAYHLELTPNRFHGAD